MAATILPIRTGSPAPCRATGPRTWPSDYEQRDPAQGYAERRGITFRERVAEIVRKVVPEKVRNMFDGLRPSAEAVPGTGSARKAGTGSAGKEGGGRSEAALRKARTKALVRHARAVDAIFDMQERGGKASPEQVKELQEARKVFEEVRPYGSHDAEAAYKKNPELVREAAGGQVNRAIRALQLETELRTDPSRRADRFVERWQKLDQTSQRQYQAGDMSGYKATRSAMGDMAKSLERDPQLESILANRKRDLGIGVRLRPPARQRTRLHPRHRPRQRPGHRTLNSAYFPPSLRHGTTTRKTLLRARQLPVLSGQQPSETVSRRQRSHARTRPYHPSENRPFPNRAVPIHHLPQDHRGHIPTPDQDQYQRRWLARIRHQPLDRRSGIMASESARVDEVAD